MKLVRDKIPQIIEKSGKSCKYHIANHDEYKARLYEKMREELDEFIDTPCDEEAADIYEVLRAMCALHALSMEVVANVAMEKRATNGSFYNGIILDSVD